MDAAIKILGDCGAALLCGGLSRRMGFDKALFLCDNKGNPLLAALAGKLARMFGEVILVTNSRTKLDPVGGLESFRRVEDLHPGQGPAGAIHSALKALPGRDIFVMACDMPLVDEALIIRLRQVLAEEKAQAAAPRRAGRPEPLHAFYGPEAGAVFQRSLAEGRLAVRDSLACLKTAYLDLDDGGPDPFRNLNSREDVIQAGLSISRLEK